jgi:SOS-response transcriptional repressor LexA
MSEPADLGNCSASEPFALRVIGDEMLPEFQDGHIIIVDPGGRVVSGCYVVAKHRDEMIFRQLITDQDNWLLHALDTRINDIPLENGLADIVGVISQRSGKRRSEHKRYDVVE